MERRVVALIKEVNKMRRCPICGKQDWCCFMDKDSVEELIVCKRDTTRCNVEGHDGQRYVYLGETKSGNSMFEEF